MTRSGLTLSLFVAVTISGCASGPATYEWVNEIDPKAYYKRDYYECNEEAKSAETLPGANAAGAVALAMKIARHRSDCLAARGWELVPIAGNTTSLAAPEANASPVDLTSSPKTCEAYVDGQFVGTTPVRALRLSPGIHKLEVRSAGMVSWLREITVQAGTPIKVHATLTPEPK